MRKLVYLLISCFIVSLCFSQSTPFYKFSNAQITSFGTPTSDGSLIFTGTQFNNLNSYDLGLMKMDKDGNPVWGHLYHSGGFETVKTLITLKNKGFLMAGSTFGGSFTYNLAVATDSMGIPTFLKMYGMGSFTSAAQTSDNNIVLGGNEYTTSSSYIMHLYKIGNNGDLIWGKSIDSCFVFSLLEAKNGNIMVTGFTKKNDPKGDIFLSCFDTNGNLLWTKQYGTAFDDEAYYIIQTNDGGFALYSVICYGGLNFKTLLIKTNNLGEVEWAKQLKSTHPYTRHIDLPNGIIQNADDTYTLEVNASLSYPYNASTVLLKMDASGKKLWSWDYQLGAFDFRILQDSGFILSVSNGTFIKANKNGLPGCEQREGLIAINDTTLTATTINFTSYPTGFANDFIAETDTLTTTITDKFVPAIVPTIEASGPMEFCEGGQVTLSLVPTPNSGSIFGEWDLRQLIYVDTTTRLYARSTTTSGCTARSADTTVIVHPLPDAKIHAIGDTTFCYGDSAHLYVETHPGYKYEWVPGNSTDTVFYPKFGWNPYVCLVTDSHNCLKSSNGIQIVMYNLPNPNIDYSKTNFCSGDSVKVYTTEKWKTYQWTLNDTIIANISSDTIWAKKKGLYRAIVTDDHNCVGKSFSQYFQENANPLPPIWINGNEFIVNFSYTDYLWFKDNISTGVTQPSLIANSPGSTYYVIVTDVNGCKGKSEDILFTSYKDKNIGKSVIVYPNPVKNTMILQVSKKYIGYTAQITDLSGKVTNTKTIKKSEEIWDISVLNPGIYFLKINDFIERIVIK